jgi:hypothetical protein
MLPSGRHGRLKGGILGLQTDCHIKLQIIPQAIRIFPQAFQLCGNYCADMLCSILSLPQHLVSPIPRRNRSNLFLVVSSKKPTSFSISFQPVEYVHVAMPVDRRERKKVTSFSMPPSVKQRLKTYAKSQRMSSSDLVTLLCVNFLECVAPARRALETSKDTQGSSESQSKS